MKTKSAYVESSRYHWLRTAVLFLAGMTAGVWLSVLAYELGKASAAQAAGLEWHESPVVIECTWRGCGRAVL